MAHVYFYQCCQNCSLNISHYFILPLAAERASFLGLSSYPEETLDTTAPKRLHDSDKICHSLHLAFFSPWKAAASLMCVINSSLSIDFLFMIIATEL